MRTRQEYITKKVELIQSFDDALALGESLKEKYSQFIPIENMNESLLTQRNNWDNERFEIVVVGEFSTGKSTFLNALLQRNILPSKATPTTATINFIRHIDELNRESNIPVAIVVYNNGDEVEISYDELTDYVAEMSKKIDVSQQIHHVDLFVDSPYLENGVVLVDTPGLQALNPEHERITKNQIKKSNASILLFNMGQSGRLTEMKFLKDLSDSIDRIFFVANRMDEVDDNEIDEVKQHLENTLMNNDYQKVYSSRAVVYPVSAFKALLSRDHTLTSEKFNDKSREQLEVESHFKDFENKLENYLFNGEKFDDYLAVPFQVINQYYNELINHFEAYKSNIENDDDLQEVEKKYELIKSQIEVRNEQLKSEINKLRTEIRNIKYNNADSFKEEFDKISKGTQNSIEAINSLDYFEEEVKDELEMFNSSYAALKELKIRELSHNIMDLIDDKIQDFEVDLSSDENLRTFKANLNTQKRKSKSFHEINQQIEEQLADRKGYLNEEKKRWIEREKIEKTINEINRKKERQEQFYQDELSFINMMMNSTSKTIQKEDVIKKRKFWFDKRGMIEVPNEKYDEIIRERKGLKKKQIEEELNLDVEIDKHSKSLVDYDTDFIDKDDLKEAERKLREESTQRKIEALNKESKYQEKQLQQEKRKVLSSFKSFARESNSDYKSLIRKLDGLKAAEQKIDEYIKMNDELLEESKRSEALLSEQLNTSLERKQELSAEIERINEYIKNKKIALELNKG